MASGICSFNRTRLDFADTRAACRVDVSGHGLGNVEHTAIGFVRNGQKVSGFQLQGLRRDKCAVPYRKPACDPC